MVKSSKQHGMWLSVVAIIFQMTVTFRKESKIVIFFYHCTVHLDNVKVPFYQQMHLLLIT